MFSLVIAVVAYVGGVLTAHYLTEQKIHALQGALRQQEAVMEDWRRVADAKRWAALQNKVALHLVK